MTDDDQSPQTYLDELRERFQISLSMQEQGVIARALSSWMPDQGPAERADVMIEAIRETAKPFKGLNRLLEKAKGIAEHRHGKARPDPLQVMEERRLKDREEQNARHFGTPGDWSTLTATGWREVGQFTREYVAEHYHDVAARLAEETGIEAPRPRPEPKPVEEDRREQLRKQAEAALEGGDVVLEEPVRDSQTRAPVTGFVDFEDGSGALHNQPERKR